MQDELERGLEKQKMRYHTLRTLYNRNQTSDWLLGEFFDIAEHEAISRQEAEEVLLYLEGEGLIERRSQGESGAITTKGILEVEQSIREPQKPTQHFSPTVIQSSL
ncbi:MAG TPA: hypothetical protein V6D03_04225 [Candidatus Caenarcaniphilales bacterium]